MATGYTKEHKETDRMVAFMRNRRGFIIYDTETTGLKKNFDRVIEFSADYYGIENGIYTKTDGMEIYIHQPINPTPETIEVHGITPEFLADKPSEPEAWNVISDFFKRHSDAVLAGYNIATFDDVFMENMALRYDATFWDGDKIDIYKCVKENLDGKYKNLGVVFEKLCPGDTFEAHNSSGDIAATWKVAVALAKENWAKSGSADSQTPVKALSYEYKDFGGRQGKYLFVKIKRGTNEYVKVMYSYYEKGWKACGKDKGKEFTESDKQQVEAQLNAEATKRGVDNFTKLTFDGSLS